MKRTYAEQATVPATVLRPVPDDGLWDIRFGRPVIVTFSPEGVRVEPANHQTGKPLCTATRIGKAPVVGTFFLCGGPTDWHVPSEKEGTSHGN